MKTTFIKIFKRHPVFQLDENSTFEHKLSAIFLTTGFLMPIFGFITNAIFQYSFMLNFPNLLAACMILFLPIIFTNKIVTITKVELYIVGFIYFPFLYFTNNAYLGAVPIYFIMIIVYFSFYLKGKELLFTVVSLSLYYSGLFIFAYNVPNSYIPYSDKLTGLIDYIIALTFMTIVVGILGAMTYKGYRNERAVTLSLLDKLKIKNKELETLTNTDHLTNIFNRRYFMEKIDMLIKEQTNDFYVLMIDIDDFKDVNDKYGHLFGDEVLRLIAESLSDCIRQYDTLARYGGEEFSVLITNSTKESCLHIAERMRKNVNDLKFRYDLTVTISIGVSQYTPNASSKDVLDNADKNLYTAKDQGKNQVVC